MSHGSRISSRMASYGTAVAPEVAPRVLLRFSGPCGVRDFFDERLMRLAPPEDPVVYFASRKVAFIAAGVDFFGCFAVFNPAAWNIVQTPEPDVFVGENRLIENSRDVVWIPAGLVNSVSNFDTAESVEALIRPTMEAERRSVEAALKRYFDELSDLEHSGFPLEIKAFWFKKPLAQRLEILRNSGVAPRWSKSE